MVDVADAVGMADVVVVALDPAVVRCSVVPSSVSPTFIPNRAVIPLQWGTNNELLSEKELGLGSDSRKGYLTCDWDQKKGKELEEMHPRPRLLQS